MSNFLEEIETIKTFNRFLDLVIGKVEKGEKVDFKSVSKLSSLIKGYFESCEQETEETSSDDFQDENNKIKDKFLKDILSGEYNGTKIRKSIIDYNRFKKNVLLY